MKIQPAGFISLHFVASKIHDEYFKKPPRSSILTPQQVKALITKNVVRFFDDYFKQWEVDPIS